ncbi:MAG: TonB family protein [Candidatus Cloacimonadota bacterium]|nr:TonB family protein [Candidatus Cloacimonadota bacterium]
MKHRIDWKVEADSYYDKAMSLAILLLLFSFMVFPKFEVEPYKAKTRVMEAEDIPIDIPEDIKPPETNVQPTVKMAVVMDDEMGDDDEELEVIDTIEMTTLDPFEEVAEEQIIGKTPTIVDYEEAPSPIKKVPPIYPTFEKNAGITGAVMLEVEVFKDGSVGAVNVLGKGITENMNKAAIDAVKQWKFKPAMANGHPVAVWVRFPVKFIL